jgi:hypothetical protein
VVAIRTAKKIKRVDLIIFGVLKPYNYGITFYPAKDL